MIGWGWVPINLDINLPTVRRGPFQGGKSCLRFSSVYVPCRVYMILYIHDLCLSRRLSASLSVFGLSIVVCLSFRVFLFCFGVGLRLCVFAACTPTFYFTCHLHLCNHGCWNKVTIQKHPKQGYKAQVPIFKSKSMCKSWEIYSN